MEDTIEICGGCGKMPRDTELSCGNFSCTRCGYDKMMLVNSDEFDRIIAELDRRFTEEVFRKRVEDVLNTEVVLNEIKVRATTIKGRKRKTNN